MICQTDDGDFWLSSPGDLAGDDYQRSAWQPEAFDQTPLSKFVDGAVRRLNSRGVDFVYRLRRNAYWERRPLSDFLRAAARRTQPMPWKVVAYLMPWGEVLAHMGAGCCDPDESPGVERFDDYDSYLRAVGLLPEESPC
jgi:hypothetical protein